MPSVATLACRRRARHRGHAILPTVSTHAPRADRSGCLAFARSPDRELPRPFAPQRPRAARPPGRQRRGAGLGAPPLRPPGERAAGGRASPRSRHRRPQRRAGARALRREADPRAGRALDPGRGDRPAHLSQKGRRRSLGALAPGRAPASGVGETRLARSSGGMGGPPHRRPHHARRAAARVGILLRLSPALEARRLLSEGRDGALRLGAAPDALAGPPISAPDRARRRGGRRRPVAPFARSQGSHPPPVGPAFRVGARGLRVRAAAARPGGAHPDATPARLFAPRPRLGAARDAGALP